MVPRGDPIDCALLVSEREDRLSWYGSKGPREFRYVSRRPKGSVKTSRRLFVGSRTTNHGPVDDGVTVPREC